MSYGAKQWQDWVLDENEALPLIEHAYKRGINTWDTVRNSRQLLRLSTPTACYGEEKTGQANS
jgi:hypothetical protein